MHYHQGDYSPIGATAPAASIVNSDVAMHSTDLYNGNIRAMQTTLTHPTTRDIMPLANAYRYDQLNRLRESKSFTNLVANQWGFSGTYTDMYYNSFAYDANGNITQQVRLSQSGQKIENMVYRYKTNSSGKLLRNRLYHVNDEVDASDWADDIDDMGLFENNPLLIETANNYSYDEEGRLIKDTQEGIKEILWRVDGKVRAVVFDSLSQKPHLLFDYDAFGRRVAKHLYDNQSEVLMKTTYYILDASGNQLSTYVHEVLNEQTHFTLKELHLYGSSHLGMVVDSVNLFTHTPSTHINTVLGLRYYNLSNHLGNVLTTLSDIKIPLSDDNQTVSGYDAAIVNTYDYSPFGVYLDGRTIESKYMPFGFNGMQRDDELKGMGNSYDFGARLYDSRLGRWLSVDQMYSKFAGWSPYNYTLNNPIFFTDPDGNIPWPVYESWVNRNGKTITRRIDSHFRPSHRPTHNGVDINLGSGSDDLGAPVLATHSGKVIAVKPYTDNDGGGNRIYIQSADGSIQTRYMHLESFADGVEVGSEIKEGQVVGYIGGSGKGAASGKVDVHLHYELLQRNSTGVMEHINPIDNDGNLIDPQKMLGLQPESKMAIYAEKLSYVNERISILSEKINNLELDYKGGRISEDKYNTKKSGLEARKDLQVMKKENLERKLNANE